MRVLFFVICTILIASCKNDNPNEVLISRIVDLENEIKDCKSKNQELTQDLEQMQVESEVSTKRQISGEYTVEQAERDFRRYHEIYYPNFAIRNVTVYPQGNRTALISFENIIEEYASEEKWLHSTYLAEKSPDGKVKISYQTGNRLR